MRIAVSAGGREPGSVVDPRFGRTKQFILLDDGSGEWTVLDNEQNFNAAQGAGIQSAARIVNAGATVLITGHCGPKAFAALSKAGVEVYTTDGVTVDKAVEQYRGGELQRLVSADVDGHW